MSRKTFLRSDRTLPRRLGSVEIIFFISSWRVQRQCSSGNCSHRRSWTAMRLVSLPRFAVIPCRMSHGTTTARSCMTIQTSVHRTTGRLVKWYCSSLRYFLRIPAAMSVSPSTSTDRQHHMLSSTSKVRCLDENLQHYTNIPRASALDLDLSEPARYKCACHYYHRLYHSMG
jgi:hypothetical protein